MSNVGIFFRELSRTVRGRTRVIIGHTERQPSTSLSVDFLRVQSMAINPFQSDADILDAIKQRRPNPFMLLSSVSIG